MENATMESVTMENVTMEKDMVPKSYFVTLKILSELVRVDCFTSFTFCNNNISCSLRLNERIYNRIHLSVFYY